MRMNRFASAALMSASSCVTAGLLTTSVFAAPTQSTPKPLPAFRKIVIVMEENQQYSTIIGNTAAPYTNSVGQQRRASNIIVRQ